MTLSILLFAAGAGMTARHDERVSESRIKVTEDEVVWSVHLAVSRLEPVVAFPAEPIDLSEKQLQSVKPEIARYLRGGLSLEVNGKPVQPEVGALMPDYMPFIATGEPYIAFVTQEFRFRPQEPVKRLRLGVRFLSDQTPFHEAWLKVTWGDQYRELIRRGPSEVLLLSRFGDAAETFVLGGARGFLIRPPHVALAFLLALLLASRGLGESARNGAAFLGAGAVTFGLSASGVVRLGGTATALLLAASVVYVAVENNLLKEGRYRWMTALVFGLVHGFGYADGLGPFLSGIDYPKAALPPIAYLLGVGLGQLALGLVVYPMTVWLRGRGQDQAGLPTYARVGSALVLVLGLGWVGEQLFHRSFMPV